VDTISISQPAHDKYDQLAGEKHGLDQEFIDKIERSQEDRVIIADKLPIFTVADGVTLDVEELSSQDLPYPDPPPSGRVAQVFVSRLLNSAVKYTKNLAGLISSRYLQQAMSR